jgi:hypothetical protein
MASCCLVFWRFVLSDVLWQARCSCSYLLSYISKVSRTGFLFMVLFPGFLFRCSFVTSTHVLCPVVLLGMGFVWERTICPLRPRWHFSPVLFLANIKSRVKHTIRHFFGNWKRLGRKRPERLNRLNGVWSSVFASDFNLRMLKSCGSTEHMLRP